jgi:hypothetical protein
MPTAGESGVTLVPDAVTAIVVRFFTSLMA